METNLFIPPEIQQSAQKFVPPQLKVEPQKNAQSLVKRFWNLIISQPGFIQFLGVALLFTCFWAPINILFGLVLIIWGTSLAKEKTARDQENADRMREKQRLENLRQWHQSEGFFEECLTGLNLAKQTTPSRIEEFIGQEQAKSGIFQAYEAAKQNGKRFPHVLLIGNQSSGKSTLALLFARTFALQTNKFYGVAAAKDLQEIENIQNFFGNLNNGDFALVSDIIDSDEKSEILSVFLPKLMVDFRIGDNSVNSFTLIATATSRKSLTPMVLASFPVVIEFENYTREQIIAIVRKFSGVFALNLDESAIETICNSQPNPATTIYLLNLIRVYIQARELPNTISAEIVGDVMATSFVPEEEEENPSGRQPISSNVKREVWRRDQGQCEICGSRNNLEYDHIIPVSKGGSNTARNIRLLCESCNRSKSDKIE